MLERLTRFFTELALFFKPQHAPLMKADNSDSNNVMSSSEKKGLLETLGKDIDIIKKRLQSITQEKKVLNVGARNLKKRIGNFHIETWSCRND